MRLVVLAAAQGAPETLLDPDSHLYLGLADAIPSGYVDPSTPQYKLTFLVPPGYPALLSLVGADVVSGLLTQIAVSAVIVALVYQIVRRVSGEKAGLIAALMIALDPASVMHSTLILTEVWFSAFLLVAAILTIRALADDSWRIALFAGLLLGVCALVRPIALFLPLWLGLAVFIMGRGKAARTIVSFALVIGAALPIGMWMGRNYLESGSATFAGVASRNLLYVRAAGALASAEGIPLGTAQSRLRARIEDEVQAERGLTLEDLQPLEVSRFESELARAVIVDHAGDAAVDWVKGALALSFGPGTQTIEEKINSTTVGSAAGPLQLALAGWQMALLLVVYLLAGASLWVARRARHTRILVLSMCALVVYFVLLSSGPESYSRFRVPFFPALCVLAGVGSSFFIRDASRTEETNAEENPERA